MQGTGHPGTHALRPVTVQLVSMKSTAQRDELPFEPTEVADTCVSGIIRLAAESSRIRVTEFVPDLGKWLLFDTDTRCKAGRVIQGRQRTPERSARTLGAAGVQQRYLISQCLIRLIGCHYLKLYDR